MRTIAIGFVVVLGACFGGADPLLPQELAFGPYTIEATSERADECVQITLHNDDYLHVNSVELVTGPGFHHSNWFFVPEHVFPGTDGTYRCADRGFEQSVATVFGGVLFAQSTQATRELQQFPPGVVVRIPPRSKLVSALHLLNPTDDPITVAPRLTLTPVAADDVETVLAAMSFMNQALALPPQMQSRFSVECDLSERHNHIFGRDPDFNLYYGLGHYHDLGRALTVEAVRDDGTSTIAFTTADRVGDVMGGPIDPRFSMAGYTKVRFTCDYVNQRDHVVRWGIGDQEMCIFLAFTDSSYNFGGGVIERSEPERPELVGNTMTYSNACTVVANDASH